MMRVSKHKYVIRNTTEGEFMKEKILLGLLLLAGAVSELFTNAQAQDAAGKAQEVLAQARAALGGEKLKALQSLSIEGNYRRTFGQGMEMSGDVTIEMIAPDKWLKTETMSLMGSMEITRLEALNGDKVWEDQQQSGGGGMVMMRRGGPNSDPKVMEDGLRASLGRLALGLVLNTPTSYAATYTYAGEAEAPEGKADVIDVKVPVGPALRLYLDQKTHRLLMMTYKGKRPRMITHMATDGPPSEAEVQKRLKESEAEAAKQPDVEYQTRFSDYREVNGIYFAHKISRGIESETNEEVSLTKIKVNPTIKPEKFVKK